MAALLEALDIHPDVCHLNEGHAAFATVEQDAPAVSWKQTSSPSMWRSPSREPANIFTTHTAVSAGFDRFPQSLIEQYLSGYAQQKLDISLHEFPRFGSPRPK